MQPVCNRPVAAETGATLHIVHVADDSPAYLAGYGGFAQVPDLPSEHEAVIHIGLTTIQDDPGAEAAGSPLG